jgi:hypothetical protein
MPELNDSVNTSAHCCAEFAQKCRQEIYVLGVGTISGAVKESSKHPMKTIADTAYMGIAAVGLTAVAAAELPVVSIVATGIGAVYGASFVWNLINPKSPHNIERNLSFQNAMSTAWRTSDKTTLQNSILDLQEKTGTDSLQVFQSFAVGGVAARYGVKTADMVSSAARFQPAILAADNCLSTGVRFGASSKVPTWDEYVNFNRRHGPVVQKSVQQFELESILRASFKTGSKEQNSGGKSEDQSATTDPAQKVEPAKAARELKNNDAEKRENAELVRGSSLYFAERFGNYHH